MLVCDECLSDCDKVSSSIIHCRGCWCLTKALLFYLCFHRLSFLLILTPTTFRLDKGKNCVSRRLALSYLFQNCNRNSIVEDLDLEGSDRGKGEYEGEGRRKGIKARY